MYRTGSEIQGKEESFGDLVYHSYYFFSLICMSQGLPGREEGTPISVGGANTRAAEPDVDRRVFVRQESRSKFYFLYFPILIFGNGK